MAPHICVLCGLELAKKHVDQQRYIPPKWLFRHIANQVHVSCDRIARTVTKHPFELEIDLQEDLAGRLTTITDSSDPYRADYSFVARIVDMVTPRLPLELRKNISDLVFDSEWEESIPNQWYAWFESMLHEYPAFRSNYRIVQNNVRLVQAISIATASNLVNGDPNFESSTRFIDCKSAHSYFVSYESLTRCAGELETLPSTTEIKAYFWVLGRKRYLAGFEVEGKVLGYRTITASILSKNAGTYLSFDSYGFRNIHSNGGTEFAFDLALKHLHQAFLPCPQGVFTIRASFDAWKCVGLGFSTKSDISVTRPWAWRSNFYIKDYDLVPILLLDCSPHKPTLINWVTEISRNVRCINVAISSDYLSIYMIDFRSQSGSLVGKVGEDGKRSVKISITLRDGEFVDELGVAKAHERGLAIRFKTNLGVQTTVGQPVGKIPSWIAHKNPRGLWASRTREQEGFSLLGVLKDPNSMPVQEDIRCDENITWRCYHHPLWSSKLLAQASVLNLRSVTVYHVIRHTMWHSEEYICGIRLDYKAGHSVVLGEIGVITGQVFICSESISQVSVSHYYWERGCRIKGIRLKSGKLTEDWGTFDDTINIIKNPKRWFWTFSNHVSYLSATDPSLAAV